MLAGADPYRFPPIGQIFINDSKKKNFQRSIPPIPSPEPCAFGARCFGNRSPFLLDPRLVGDPDFFLCPTLSHMKVCLCFLGSVSSAINRNMVEQHDGDSGASYHVVAKSNVTTSSQAKKNVLPNIDKDFLYPMNCKPHGLCLIVNNVDFETLRKRGGSDLDAKQLSELFTKLQYKVEIVRNQTAKQLKDTLLQFVKKSDHKAADSMVVCLLSHGLEGQIYGVDGVLLSIPDLLAMFNGYMAKDLIGKPKLFFIQACRGSDYDHGADVTDSGHSDNVEEYHVTRTTAELLTAAVPYDKPEALVEPETIPAEADMLIAYSTVPGYVSWSNLQKGSWFVQALVDVFSAYAHTEDVVSMLVRVNGKVAREFESFNRKKQIPAPVIMLTKKVFFFPPS